MMVPVMERKIKNFSEISIYVVSEYVCIKIYVCYVYLTIQIQLCQPNKPKNFINTGDNSRSAVKFLLIIFYIIEGYEIYSSKTLDLLQVWHLLLVCNVCK